MMMKTIGFIGAGQMAQAMISGILHSKLSLTENIMASAHTENTLAIIKQKYQIQTTLDNKEVAKFADILILAVKPVFILI
jgi:pyrroline-5-carboxylate reductase